MIWRLQRTGSPESSGTSVAPANARASSTAPRALRNPAPWVRWLYPARASAVYSRMALTAFGVRAALASSISAMAPVTTGAAMLVPVRLRYGSLPVCAEPQRREAGLAA